MEYKLIVQNGVITIRESDDIEYGWYVEVIGTGVTLYDCEGEKIDDYETILEAIEAGESLT